MEKKRGSVIYSTDRKNEANKRYIFFEIGHDFAIIYIVVLVFKIFNDDSIRFLLKVSFSMFLSYIFGISFHIFAPTRENPVRFVY